MPSSKLLVLDGAFEKTRFERQRHEDILYDVRGRKPIKQVTIAWSCCPIGEEPPKSPSRDSEMYTNPTNFVKYWPKSMQVQNCQTQPLRRLAYEKTIWFDVSSKSERKFQFVALN
eukprot:2883251-Amphidinium_carterae.1